MKKILSILTISLFSINTAFAAVATQDIYVMNKDSQQALSTVNFYAQMVQQMKQQVDDASKRSGNMSEAMNLLTTMANSNKFISDICTGCSSTTMEQLQNWKNQNAKNICDSLNNNIQMIQGHVLNMQDVNKYITQIQSAISGGTLDPSAVAQLGVSMQNATNATLSEMNQTQQQLAAYNLQQQQADKVQSKINGMKMNKSMFGVSSLCNGDC